MELKTAAPKCMICGKFVSVEKCITARRLDEFPPDGPEFFEDLEPYHKKCWNEVFPDKQVEE